MHNLSSAFFSTQRRAAMVGLFLAPVVPAISVAILVPPAALSALPWFAGLVMCFYLVALALGSLVGLPILFLLAYFRLLNWAAVLVGGFIAGVVSITLFGLLLQCRCELWLYTESKGPLRPRYSGSSGVSAQIPI